LLAKQVRTVGGHVLLWTEVTDHEVWAPLP
jgi:hypothetical protein